MSSTRTALGRRVRREHLGGDTASGTKQIHVYLNGEVAAPDGKLANGDNVVIAYGTPDSFPKLPPADALEGA